MSSYRIVKLSRHDIFRVERRVVRPWGTKWKPITRFEMDYTGESGYSIPEEFSTVGSARERVEQLGKAEFEVYARCSLGWHVVE